MHLEHIAIWTNQLERLKDFYETYFQAEAGKKYQNPAKGFESYFLSFSTGARLELMSAPGVYEAQADPDDKTHGYAHISIATGSEQGVDELTDRLYQDGFRVMQSPRYTGDGYYESVVLDPDGNRLELTAEGKV